MAAEWYYALGDQQKGPVSWETLQQLAAAGKLQRGDKVWREGLADWKEASRVEGLCPRDEGIRTHRRQAQVVTEAVEDELEEDLPRRRKKKRKRESSPAAMAGIIGSCIAGGILLIVIVIVLLMRAGRNNDPPPLPPAGAGGAAAQVGGGVAPAGWQPVTYTLNLQEDEENTRIFNLQQGQRVEIIVKTQGRLLGEDPDVDLFVTRVGDPAFFLSDEAITKDCYLVFIAPATDQYEVKVDNLGPGRASSTVTVR